MIESQLLLVLATVAVIFVSAARQGPQVLQTRRSGKTPTWALGLLLFVATIYISYAFIVPWFTTWLGAFVGPLVGGLLSLFVVYFIYAFLVRKTGYKPTL